MDNELVPKHEVLDGEKAEKLLEFYKVTPELLPKIKKSDPGISHLEAKIGDIIKITRYEPQIGKTLYYRVVVRD
ncbi:MAG: DNA-directed RNA polymerase subunit H [Candidatus Altiarchaeales archaeon ex4484_96]|nr:MAG: DNA-directed RNA polymerase subunit H [Candidatus Altiarchaeales archaeon ex4484_96]